MGIERSRMGIFNFELVAYTAIVLLYVLLKRKYPNFLFPGLGINMVFPPKEEDLETLKGEKEKGGKKKPAGPNANSNKPLLVYRRETARQEITQHLFFFGEYEISLLFVITTVTHFLIMTFVNKVLAEYISISYLSLKEAKTNLNFYLILVTLYMIIYYLVKVVALSNYEKKVAMIVGVLSTILLAIFTFGFRGLLDFNFERAVRNWQVHVSHIFSNFLDGTIFERVTITRDQVLILQFIWTFFISFGMVPVVVRFGNVYSDLVKNIAALEEKLGEPSETPESREERKKSLANEKRMMRIFNINLTLTLVILSLWLQPLVKPWAGLLGNQGNVIMTMKFILIGVQIALNMFTFRYELSSYMDNAFEYLWAMASLAKKEIKDDKLDIKQVFAGVQAKVRSHLHSFNYRSLQLLSRIFIPALLVLLIISKTDASSVGAKEIMNTHDLMTNFVWLNENNFGDVAGLNKEADQDSVQYVEPNLARKQQILNTLSDMYCVGTRNKHELVSNLLYSPTEKSLSIKSVSGNIGFYHQELSTRFSDQSVEIAKEFLRKLNTHGLVTSELYSLLFEYQLFTYYLVTYAFTIFYIFYRQKTIAAEEEGK
eukprot:TRINITY_DN5707_c0_g1_i3.p1 TRINITY_DN5707_c0_g1~~TRINITY_DN5707_c0_g1_i3.p1  ORF type:complete len:630 (+),score=113.19 TRINITY_DN5707_c0_g1_i3:95-1891(+)